MKGVQIRIDTAKITLAMAALSEIFKLALWSITLFLSFTSEERLARKERHAYGDLTRDNSNDVLMNAKVTI